ncbi:ABC-F family ATP-binding cassette domain-containing protein [Paenibacillus alginolyticus]|uniref:ABC-F family ATP-binding cassette domain-containing protein n=1 Tax=Paenibacillus alginolyticus TaxID=59839 RepID=A0ABT4G9Z3_9BACL|nr:ABC-F family ATP-binding cassette domain-containing protein [Paenibacillus alginolyticus]MCY9692982.1 ABC-F family ATP-binding cassette domain-containing protein [Paenibacillus alginolyticus]MEC0148869.1 ABC-F family ATP-binding cassette domain-containing protein [Paenibacillus alginolyticus]
MNILSAVNITKTFGDKVLFDDISFTVNEKQRIGLIGVNGTGKSTLLKLLAGLETADRGKLVHANHFRVEYLPQNPEFDPNSTVLEQVFHGDTPLMKTLRDYELALADLELDASNVKKQTRLFSAQSRMDEQGAWEASTLAKTVLMKLGISEFDKPVGQLSGGQRKRVAMARVLIQPADLLILDEPTNHIDNETAIWLEEFLSKWRGALLLVTHDRYFLERVTSRILELDRGKIYSYEGNYEWFLEKKAERMESEASSEDKRQNLLRRELAWLRRGAKARTTKQKARIGRAEELRDRKVDGPGEKLDMALAGSRLGKKVMELEDVTKAFESGKPLLSGFSYIVMPRDRLGIIGPNGSGKSTLLNMLAGRIQPDSGTIETGTTVKLAYYTQENVEMDEKMRVIEYIKEAAEQIRTSDGETISASQMLERFLFSPTLQWSPIGKLSGGERRRLYLLRTLMGEPNVLLLDEPTNDLDIQTLTILEDYLDQFPGAVITVSHDRYFLDRTVSHLFAFDGRGQIEPYIGNYSDYLEEKQEQAEADQTRKELIRHASSAKSDGVSNTASPIDSSSPVAAGASNANRPKKLTFKEQKEWDEIESTIASLEDKAASLKKQIEAAGSDFDRVRELYEQEQQTAVDLEAAMERWTYLSELLEEIERNK